MKKYNLLCLALSAFSSIALAGDNKGSLPCHANITISPSTPQTVCLGSPITITATGGVSYQWSNGSTTSSITVTPSVTTKYILNGTDILGCTASDTLLVTVDNPGVSVTASRNMLCPGSYSVLSGQVQGGSAPFTYQWSPGLVHSLIDTVTTPSYYMLTVTDASGCSSGAGIPVTSSNLSVWLPPSMNTCGNQGAGGVYPNVSGGLPPFRYHWSNGDSLAQLTLSGLSSGTYSLNVTDLNGCSASASIAYTYHPAPTITIKASSSTIMVNGIDTLTASGAVQYNWSNGQTGNRIIVTGTATSNEMIFTAGGTDANGCYGSAQVAIAVSDVTISLPHNTIQCAGNGTTTYYLGASVSGGNPPYNYSWNTGQTTQVPWIYVTSAGTYTVTVTDAGNFSATASGMVTLHSAPKITISANSSQLFSNSYDTLKASGGISYTWNVQSPNRWWYVGNNNSEIIVSDSNSTTSSNITVYGSDSSGCTGSAQYIMTPPTRLEVSLPANSILSSQKSSGGDNINGLFAMVSGGIPPYTFTWTLPAGQQQTTQVPWLSNLTLAGTYKVSVSDHSGISTYATGIVQIVNNAKNNWNWQPSPDTTVSHASCAPSIYYAGNVSIGAGCSSTVSETPLHQLDVHGNADIDSTLTIGTNYLPKGYSLAVNGKIIATDVMVKLRNSWPDYVFGKDYTLPKLEELEQYIYLNHHLPGLPSAEEMQKNGGISVEDMITKQTQKIEEMTLYIIDLNKRLNTLEQENNKLKAKN